MTPPDGTDRKTPLSDDCKNQIANLINWYMHGDCDSVYDVLCQLAEWCFAQTAAQLAECRADNASLRAGIEQAQIHQGHLQEELTAALAERDAARRSPGAVKGGEGA